MNSRAQEAYNAAKLGAVLADYGYTCQRLVDDYNGADILAIPSGGTGDILRIQLKGEFTIAQKYVGKNLHIAFPKRDMPHRERPIIAWYLFDHDEVLRRVEEDPTINWLNTKSWNSSTHKSWNTGWSATVERLLDGYRLHEVCYDQRNTTEKAGLM
ncbi:hypothetical protein [Roseiconus lacunae]|uniref:hypothetical protein n=1 Tax=Roseiconus lacunae TaxID=2605694 RepID=UPI001E30C403|nr:hypothetical protein [Roseiconus lacunae]